MPVIHPTPFAPADPNRRRAAAILLGLLASSPSVWAESPRAGHPVAHGPRAFPPAPPSPEYLAAQQRWKNDLAAFEAADRSQPPAEGGVLFVGSSTVRMWSSLAQDFRQWPVVINRGFGGSTLHECRLLTQDLVLRYKPRHVLVYAGDNDLNAGRSPRQVMDDFAAFMNAVREQLPHTRISFISIKPSPSRLRLLPDVQLSNALIAAYLRTQANVDYIDVYTPMVDAQGLPRPELFLKDGLHLNAAGYQLWRQALMAQLQEPQDAQEANPRTVAQARGVALPKEDTADLPAQADTAASSAATR